MLEVFGNALHWEFFVQVNYVLGGVARNIAECMSKLGTKPFMISVVGLDMAGTLYLMYIILVVYGILQQEILTLLIFESVIHRPIL